MKVRRIIRGCTVLYDTIHLEGQEIYIYCYISVNIKKYKQLSCYPLECMNPLSSKLLEDDRILIRRLLIRYCLRSIKSKRMQCSYRIICISKSLSYYYYLLCLSQNEKRPVVKAYYSIVIPLMKITEHYLLHLPTHLFPRINQWIKTYFNNECSYISLVWVGGCTWCDGV